MNFQSDLPSSNYGNIINHKYEFAVLPWGATEPHNYHLPYLTDCYLAHNIALDGTKIAFEKYDIKGMVLPPIPFGSQNPGQHHLPFCIHARYETQKALLTDIVASLDRQGMNKLFIVNGHGGNSFKNMIRDLAIDYPNFLITVSNWYEILPQSDFFEERDDHAGEMETSVMMHYHPELVDLSLAGSGCYKPFASENLRNGVAWMPRDWSKVSEDTGIGNPMKATAEKGKKCAEAVSDKLAELFMELTKKSLY